MAQETTTGGVLFSPEAILMLSLAAFVDIVELFIPFEPIDPVDIFAMIFIGGWMYLRSSIRGTETREVPRPREAREGMKKIVKKVGEIGKKAAKAAKWTKRLKWLRPLFIIIEMVPLIGNLPFWVVAVYTELKYG